LVNFSYSGLSIKLQQPLAKGTRLGVRLNSPGDALRDLLIKAGIDQLSGEVRWAYSEGTGFVHGVLLSGLTETQGDSLVQYLCEFAFTRGVGDEAPSAHKKKAAS
jgi:hypothetical protein